MLSEVGDIINTLNIKKFITEKINKNFKEQVIDSSIKENYQKPCFFVYLENSELHSKNNNQDEVTNEVFIQYQNRKYKEYQLNEIKEKLFELFSCVQIVEGTRLLITNIYSDIDDFNLYVNFDVSYRKKKNKEIKTHETMSELKLEVK